jgi:hypothetical protein
MASEAQTQPLMGVKWQSATVQTSPHVGLVETVACVVLAVVVLRLEFHRRAARNEGANTGGLRSGKSYAESYKQILFQCAPEALGLVTCLTIVAALLARGNEGVSEEQREVWEQIKRDWPLLTCGDTLLTLQSMLRFIVLLSAVLRSTDAGLASVSDEAAVAFAGAAFSRALLFCRSSAYLLDGPVGGNLPSICDIASLALALALGRKALWRRPFVALITIVSIMWLSFRHRMKIDEGDGSIDALFVAAYIFDCVGAFVYLARSVLIEAPLHYASLVQHMLMALQASFGAYYFIYALNDDGLADVGKPIQVMQLTNFLSAGAYLTSAAMCLAEISLGAEEAKRADEEQRSAAVRPNPAPASAPAVLEL